MFTVIHMVRPTTAKTFYEYVTLHIVPYLKSHITTTVERIDAVWDTYPDGNLKALTRLTTWNWPKNQSWGCQHQDSQERRE